MSVATLCQHLVSHHVWTPDGGRDDHRIETGEFIPPFDAPSYVTQAFIQFSSSRKMTEQGEVAITRWRGFFLPEFTGKLLDRIQWQGHLFQIETLGEEWGPLGRSHWVSELKEVGTDG